MATAELVRKVKKMSLSNPTGFTGRHAFAFLNVSQFLSAFNDNLFKFLTIFLLIDIKGVAASNDILFLVGVAFVLPFLMFSSSAGVLADRFSKQKLIVFTKVLEVIIISLAFFVYAHKMVWGCYFLVFLLSFQSALLSPPKYSIVPELVRREHIAKANGWLTSFTYLAVIVGSGLATFLTDISGKNFSLCLSVCWIAAIIGLITAIYIPTTEANKTKTKIFTANVLNKVYSTMKFCKRTPRLRLAVLGSSFFLFIGGYLQLNIIPFAIDFLKMSETGGGYLFFSSSIGIALGSLVGGRACKKEVDLGLACFALIGLGVMTFCLVLSSHSLLFALLSLTGLGFFGGMFVVPLDSYVQAFSPSEIRGQVVAASSFLSFFGVLLAPLALYLFGNILNVSSRTGFMFIGMIVFGVAIILIKYLSSAFLNFVSKTIIQPFFDLHFIGYPFGVGHQEDKVAIVLNKPLWLQLLLLLGENSKMHIFIVKMNVSMVDRFLNFFSGIDVLYCNHEEKIDSSLVRKRIQAFPFAIKPVFLFTSAEVYQSFIEHHFFEELASSYNYTVKLFLLKNKSHFKPAWSKPLSYRQMTFQFEDWKPIRLAPIQKSKELVWVKRVRSTGN